MIYASQPTLHRIVELTSFIFQGLHQEHVLGQVVISEVELHLPNDLLLDGGGVDVVENNVGKLGRFLQCSRRRKRHRITEHLLPVGDVGDWHGRKLESRPGAQVEDEF